MLSPAPPSSGMELPQYAVVTHSGSVLEGLATISESLSSLSDGLLHERSNVGNDRTLGWCEQ